MWANSILCRKGRLRKSPEEFDVLVNLVTVFVKSFEQSYNVTGSVDLTQTPFPARGYVDKGLSCTSMQ